MADVAYYLDSRPSVYSDEEVGMGCKNVGISQFLGSNWATIWGFSVARFWAGLSN